MLHLKTLHDFGALAILVGTSQGGIQALSRSYFGKLIPKENSSEFFFFFYILGKFSAIIGPILVGIVTQLTGKSTIGAGLAGNLVCNWSADLFAVADTFKIIEHCFLFVSKFTSNVNL